MHKEIWEANASSKYAPKKLLSNLKRIPRSGPLILKDTLLQIARSIISNDLNAIKSDSNKRVTHNPLVFLYMPSLYVFYCHIC